MTARKLKNSLYGKFDEITDALVRGVTEPNKHLTIKEHTATQPHSHTATQPHSHTATQPHSHTATQPQEAED